MEFTIENFISEKLKSNNLKDLKQNEIIFEINFYINGLNKKLIGVYDAENLIILYYKFQKDKDKFPHMLMYGEILFNESLLKVNIFEKEKFSINLSNQFKKNIVHLIETLLFSLLGKNEIMYFNIEKNKTSLNSNLFLNFSDEFNSNRYFLYHKEESKDNIISGMLFLGDKIQYLFGDNQYFLEQKLFKDINLSKYSKGERIKNFELEKEKKELFNYSLNDFLFNQDFKSYIFDFKNLVFKTNEIIKNI